MIAMVSLVLSAFPAAFFVAEAASTLHGPVSTTVDNAAEFTTGVIDASGHENLTLDFDYDAESLDASSGPDVFTYGWRTGAGDTVLGTVIGLNEGPAGDETDSVSVSLPVGAQMADLEIYMSLVANTAGPDDQVLITNLTVAGDLLPCSPQFDAAGLTNIQNSTTGDYFDTVDDALADCDTSDGDTISLLGDVSTTEQIDLDRPIIFDGNGFTINAAFAKTSNSNNSAIGVGADDVTVTDIVLDGTSGTQLHGINVYVATGVTVSDVTSMNFRSGMVVNGSTVDASNFKTSGNIWHGINVAPGSGVTTASILNISNTSVHDEVLPTPHIYTDDANAGPTIEVNDLDSQYTVVTPYGGTSDVAYFLKDKTKPVVEVLAPAYGLITKTDFTFQVKATDNEALNKVVANIKNEAGGNIASCINVSAAGATEYIADCTVDVDPLANGIYFVRTNASDVAGNLSQTLSHKFVVDRTKPVIEVLDPADNYSTSGNFDITVKATDDNAVGKVVINLKDGSGAHLSTCLNETVSTITTEYITGCTVDVSVLADGAYQFKTNTLDSVGNLSNTITQHFVVDRTKPYIEVVDPVDGFITYGDFNIVVHATDNLGLGQVVINLKDEFGNNIAPCLNELAGGVTDYTTSCTVDVETLGPGIYGFKTNVRDLEGNLSNTVSQSFEIQEAPNASLEITSPANDYDEVSGVYGFAAEYIDDDMVIDTIQWAVRLGTCAINQGTVAGNVDGFSDASSFTGTTFLATLDTTGWINDDYCFIVNPKEQSGEKNLRETRPFVLNNEEIIETYLITGSKFEVAGESNTPVSGWTIFAFNASSEESLSTTTDALGNYEFEVTAGDWTVSEEVQTDWTQLAVYQDGSQVVSESSLAECIFSFGNESEEADGSCDFYNEYTAPIIVPVSNSGGSSSSGTRVASFAPATSQGLVLGVSTSQCGMLIKDYLRMGEVNNPYEVTKLQAFLLGQGYFTVSMNGMFDAATDSAVRAYQEVHRAEILTPWVTAGILTEVNPSGWVYKLTRWKMNNTVCPGGEAYPSLI